MIIWRVYCNKQWISSQFRNYNYVAYLFKTLIVNYNKTTNQRTYWWNEYEAKGCLTAHVLHGYDKLVTLQGGRYLINWISVKIAKTVSDSEIIWSNNHACRFTIKNKNFKVRDTLYPVVAFVPMNRNKTVQF